ncbi:MAG: trehalose-6-phosphate synthase [Actinomycetia bacterium]|nr:trehalose-6-phosphate synthase [Actinomycetes bacterium]MCP3910540.1 trehalose-6-phosphate synthase [Actinomycetes bacterium]MCP4083916.1 trehalose-6-phosphate synthase [Actinomycetes bacterium]
MADVQTPRPIVLASNRGPVSFKADRDGELRPQRGAGGLVSGLAPLVHGTDTLWIAAAMSDDDRRASRSGVSDGEGFRIHLLDIEASTFRLAYDVVANAVLWFVHHGLWDLVRQPRFDHRFAEAWEHYRRYNDQFADAIVAEAPPGAAVLVQDYHLALVATRTREARPDLRLVLFTHTPFAPPAWMEVLPTEVATELLDGMAQFHAVGFHTRRWADDFEASCQSLLGRRVTAFAATLGTDARDIRDVSASADSLRAQAEIDELAGDRQLIVRTERIELSKNLLRGFWAYGELLERHPEHRGKVTFLARCYPSREGVADYLSYGREAETVVEHVNRRWGTDGWQPIVWEVTNDYPGSVAALCRYDVLLINPIRDGLNLVASEGPLVNGRNGVVCLSTQAGAYETFGDLTLAIHPYDISQTADALHQALTMPADERASRAAAIRKRSEQRSPADWLADLVTQAG